MPVYEMTAYPKTLELDGESLTVMPLKPEHEKLSWISSSECLKRTGTI